MSVQFVCMRCGRFGDKGSEVMLMPENTWKWRRMISGWKGIHLQVNKLQGLCRPEHVPLLQKTQVGFPAPIFDNLQQPITLAPRELLVYVDTCIHMHPPPQT